MQRIATPLVIGQTEIPSKRLSRSASVMSGSGSSPPQLNRAAKLILNITAYIKRFINISFHARLTAYSSLVFILRAISPTKARPIDIAAVPHRVDEHICHESVDIVASSHPEQRAAPDFCGLH